MRLRFPLLKTTYEWLLDEELTPYFLINAHYPNVLVPLEFVEDGQIVLDASADAVEDMRFDEDGISFQASFDGDIRNIFFPIAAVDALYAEETEQGLFMTDDPTTILVQEGEGSEAPPPAKETKSKPPIGRSHLKVIK